MGCESCAYKVCKRLDKIDIQPCDLLVVGDIPQPREVVHNQVMQGPGRKILDQAFASVGLVGKKIHYVTAVQCAIPKGKNKTIKKDIVNCHETLLEIIKACNPKAVLLLGKVAYQVFEGRVSVKVTEAQGRLIEGWDIPVMPVTNPGAILRSPNDYKPFIQMLLKFKKQVFGEELYDPGTTHWMVLDTEELFDIWLNSVRKLPANTLVGLDIETTDIDYRTAEFCVMGVSYEKNKTLVIPRHMRHRIQEMFDVFKECDLKCVWQNGSYDKKVLWRRHLANAPIDEDTMLQHYLLDETSAHDLGYLTKMYLNAEEYKYKMNQNFKAVTLETYDTWFDSLVERVAVDADLTRQLCIRLDEELDKPENASLRHIYDVFIIPAANYLCRLEQNGVLIDEAYLQAVGADYEKRLEKILEDIQDEAQWDWDPEQYMKDLGAKSAPEDFNPGSPKQMQWMVFNKLKLKPRVKKGASTSEDVLRSIPDPPKLIELVLKYRGVKKEYSTYVQGLLKRRDTDGRVRAHFNLAGTATGRLSCKEPNLQNLPSYFGVGNIRRACIAQKGYVYAEIDYSGAELRWLAVLSKDENLTRIFVEGINLHDETARLMYGPNFTAQDRMRAKAVNFGIMYGRQAGSFKDEFGISLEEAQDLIDRWLNAYPKAKHYLEWCEQVVDRGGYLQSPFGNRRRFGLVSEVSRDALHNEAKNMAIQCASSHLLICCCLQVEETMRKMGVRMINMIHDSVLLEIPADPEIVQRACQLMGHTMTEMPKKLFGTEVPFAYDVDMGLDWGHLNAYDDSTGKLKLKDAEGNKLSVSFNSWYPQAVKECNYYSAPWYQELESSGKLTELSNIK